MYRRLQFLLALWFIVQIVVPFTAPLQSCDLATLLGTAHHSGTHGSSAVPATLSEADSADTLDDSAAREVLALLPSPTVLAGARTLARLLANLPSPHVQQTILRV